MLIKLYIRSQVHIKTGYQLQKFPPPFLSMLTSIHSLCADTLLYTDGRPSWNVKQKHQIQNFWRLREGFPDQKVPKYRHCLNGGGGVWPLPGFLWRICPHALRALKGDHSSPKSDNFPTKVFLFPQNRSFNHIYLTFSLSKMILRSFVEKCRESHFLGIMGQIAQDAWIGGWGGQPNFGNACILGTSGSATPP